jgi:transcriptional regulator with XRE-family HTH domain
VASARSTILKRFGARVRALRHQRGITQEQLANAAGIDRAYMSGIELGRHNPGVVHVYRIAKVLRVPPSALFPE